VRRCATEGVRSAEPGPPARLAAQRPHRKGQPKTAWSPGPWSLLSEGYWVGPSARDTGHILSAAAHVGGVEQVSVVLAEFAARPARPTRSTATAR
jgi:hypothetical protein